MLSLSGDTSVTGNTANAVDGGGITNCGILNIQGSLNVTGNSAVGKGGGIWSNSTLNV